MSKEDTRNCHTVFKVSQLAPECIYIDMDLKWFSKKPKKILSLYLDIACPQTQILYECNSSMETIDKMLIVSYNMGFDDTSIIWLFSSIKMYVGVPKNCISMVHNMLLYKMECYWKLHCSCHQNLPLCGPLMLQ